MNLKLNTDIALLFMGWQLRDRKELAAEGMPIADELANTEGPIIIAERSNSVDMFSRETLPNFAEDISAAWEVAEKMGSNLISISRNLAGSWVVMVKTPLGSKQFSAQAAPEAICRAAMALCNKS